MVKSVNLLSKIDKPIIGLAVMQTLIWAILFYSFPALVLFWQAEFGWSLSQTMGAFTSALLISALASPLSGFLIDKGVGRFLLAGACLLGGLLLIALSMAQDLIVFYAIWSLMGLIFAAGLYDPCFSIVTRAKREKARKSITTITLFAGFASSISYPVVIFLSQTFDWRVPILAGGILCITVGAPLGYFSTKALERREDQLREFEEREAQPPHRSRFKTPAFWGIALGFALISLASGSIVSHLFPILADRGITDTLAIFAGSCIGPLQVFGRIFIALFGQNLSPKSLSVLSSTGVSIGVGALVFVSGDTSVALIVFILCYGSGYGLISIARPDLSRSVLGNSQFGAIYGTISLASILCAAIAPLATSFVAQTFGYGVSLLALSGLAALGTLLLTLVQPLERKNAVMHSRGRP